ncbi:MAG: hypothetical protein J6Y69_11000 [Treponema sp.]|nr:hypothetical protein [Treponema sp.]
MKNKNLAIVLFSLLAMVGLLGSCNGKKSKSPLGDMMELKPVQKSHVWYYFSDTNFHTVDLPQHSPYVAEKAWTEVVRITSASTSPDPSTGYALVNRLGMLTLDDNGPELHTDASIFSGVTADSLVFSNKSPLFYLYRSSFFNVDFEKSVSNAVQPSRPFLVEYDPLAKAFFPLVSYDNLNLSDDEQIAGYFWDGETWACSAKKVVDNHVSFTYFYWTPYAPLTELSPALANPELFTFRTSTEEEYRNLSMPKAFSAAPDDLKKLCSSIPSEFTVSVLWKDGSGTSAVSYYQQGSNSVPLMANGSSSGKYSTLIFADGTTYIIKTAEISENQDVTAFRLPLLPAGYTYGDFAIAGDTLYVAWEESSFYKTGRTGFLQVDLKAVLEQVK